MGKTYGTYGLAGICFKIIHSGEKGSRGMDETVLAVC